MNIIWTIFTGPEENNNCFSIIAWVIIREIVFSFYYFFFKNIKESRGGPFGKLVLQYYNDLTRGDYSEILTRVLSTYSS